ncbi:MAG: choice-of-anchor J domain-containing protein [Ferruginibacter sp.]
MTKLFGIFIFLMSLSATSFAQVDLYNESFNSAVPLPAGWASQNNSEPIGTTGWGQGNAAVFPSNSGAPTAYIFANFQNTAGAGIISNWLLMPNVTLTNGDVFKFYTSGTGSNFPDNLQVRMSLNGASTNVGTSSSDVGDFTTLLLEINPTLTVGTYPDVWTQYTINITGLAAPTSGRLAFRYYVTDGGPLGNNSDYIGIDDVVYTTFPPPCSGTPTPGNTISSATDVCPGINFNLSVQNNTPGSGVTYQWQSSPDNVTYTNIAGATTPTLTVNQVASTYYQLVVTCAGNNGNSTPVLVPMSPATACYCSSSANSTADEDIFNVTIGDLSNSSDCSTIAPGALSVQNRYSNYTNGAGIPAPANLVSGGTNPFSVRIGTCGGNFTNSTAMWIDLNQNGAFEASEKLYLSAAGTPGPHTETANVLIPSTAPNGTTRMRVVNVETGTPGNINSCGTYAWGETEDYLVNITPCVPVTVTANPVNSTIVCGANTTFSVTLAGSYPAYQWQLRTSAAAPWSNISNNAMYSGATTNTLTITEALSSMNGYQYRVVFSGSCTATDGTGIATLTVTPLIATVNPTDATICNGTSQQLSITNTAAAPTTITINSAALSLAIPDNTENGVSTDLTVAGIPAGANITAMSVKFNLSHTYCGDMLINLKAPNGNILALDKYLTGTAAQAGTYPNTGFVNTIISSAGTTALGTAATQPITGTFRADAINGTITGPTVQNPLGFNSNAAGFADLYSVPNGTWTLALADGGPLDLGTLTSWSMDITYVAPTLATGVWSPVTNLFTDAALTIPYTGTSVNTVYAAPTTSTDYSVVVQTATCTSDPLIIPITVANPLGTISQPANATACTNGSVTFTADANAGNPIAYQWEVSTDGGASYTSVVDGGVYSGATTNTLTISGATNSLNGNRYRLVLSVAACGSSATTNAATLTINANPAVTVSAAPFTSLYPGLKTTLTATVTPANANNVFQWYLNGEAIAGANAATYTAEIDGLGTYTVDVTDPNACGASSSNSVLITDSLNTTLFIYPNPNNGVFQVRFYDKANGVASPRSLNIYDSKGARVYREDFNVSGFGRMDVDISKFGKGVYFIDLVDAAGKRLKTERVIIF